jgi:L-amino acid N-acyltransferase YncA
MDRTASDPLPDFPRICHDKAGRPFQVRPFTAADRPALNRFYDEFEPKRAAQGLPPQGEERIARWLDGVLPHGVHLLAEREAELLGHAFMVPTTEPGMAEYAIFLRQAARGGGVGTALNRVSVDAARTAGFQRLWLSVEPHNRAAIRSYEKVGFRFRSAAVLSPEAEMELAL